LTVCQLTNSVIKGFLSATHANEANDLRPRTISRRRVRTRRTSTVHHDDNDDNDKNDDHNNNNNNNNDDNPIDTAERESARERLHRKRVKRRTRRRAVRSLAGLLRSSAEPNDPLNPDNNNNSGHKSTQLIVQWVRMPNSDVTTSVALRGARFVLASGRVTALYVDTWPKLRQLLDAYFCWANAAAGIAQQQPTRFSLTQRAPLQRYCVALLTPTLHLVDERSPLCAALRGSAECFVRYDWTTSIDGDVWRVDYQFDRLTLSRCAMAVGDADIPYPRHCVLTITLISCCLVLLHSTAVVAPFGSIGSFSSSHGIVDASAAFDRIATMISYRDMKLIHQTISRY
jgi:hypothetical protein